MKKYQKTGVISQQSKEALYGDFSSVGDFAQSKAIVLQAESQFQNLPSDVRKRFKNNVKEFLDYVADEKNSEQLVKWGLKEAPPEKPEPVEVKVISETPTE
jgi:hypothetical protein